MPTNIYVDTNIVVDMCDNTRACHKSSFKCILDYLNQEECELFINSDTLTNLFYILSNHSTLSEAQVLDKMNFVYDSFTLVPIESQDVKNALDLCADNSTNFKDYEDAMQYVCAKKVNANIIVTNDRKFVSKDIKVVNTKKKIKIV